MILGLDISTSIVGVCVLQNNEIVCTDYIDLRKIGSFFEKANDPKSSATGDIEPMLSTKSIVFGDEIVRVDVFRRSPDTDQTFLNVPWYISARKTLFFQKAKELNKYLNQSFKICVFSWFPFLIAIKRAVTVVLLALSLTL